MSAVLVVERDATVRAQFRKLVEAEGYDVVEAADAGEAVELLSGVLIRLVVVDLADPGVGGLGLIAKLQHQSPEMAIVTMSTFDRPAELRGDVSYWVVAHLKKPLGAEHVKRVLRQGLALQSPRDGP